MCEKKRKKPELFVRIPLVEVFFFIFAQNLCLFYTKMKK